MFFVLDLFYGKQALMAKDPPGDKAGGVFWLKLSSENDIAAFELLKIPKLATIADVASVAFFRYRNKVN